MLTLLSFTKIRYTLICFATVCELGNLKSMFPYSSMSLVARTWKKSSTISGPLQFKVIKWVVTITSLLCTNNFSTTCGQLWPNTSSQGTLHYIHTHPSTTQSNYSSSTSNTKATRPGRNTHKLHKENQWIVWYSLRTVSAPWHVCMCHLEAVHSHSIVHGLGPVQHWSQRRLLLRVRRKHMLSSMRSSRL